MIMSAAVLASSSSPKSASAAAPSPTGSTTTAAASSNSTSSTIYGEPANNTQRNANTEQHQETQSRNSAQPAQEQQDTTSKSSSKSSPSEPSAGGTNSNNLRLNAVSTAGQTLPESSETAAGNRSRIEGAPGEAASSAGNKSGTSPPALSGELRNIINQVAKTGVCTWLPWMPSGQSNSGSGASAGVASSNLNMSVNSRSNSQGRPNHTSSMSSPPSQSPSRKNSKGASSFASLTKPAHSSRPAVAVAAGPKRKKQSNGVHNRPRKRPLNGTDRTFSGSEQEDSCNYDSEGTLASLGSWTATEKRRLTSGKPRSGNGSAGPSSVAGVGGGTSSCNSSTVAERDLQNDLLSMDSAHDVRVPVGVSEFSCLRDAFRKALGLVLEEFYNRRGGYKLSVAERRRHENLERNNEKSGESVDPAERVFQRRKQRLQNMVGPAESSSTADSGEVGETPEAAGPPFTIQRVAEVLISPNRYYTQTHKLCNCLEKLLLVTSTTDCFGGTSGVHDSKSHRESAALAEEQSRLRSEFRKKRKQRAASATGAMTSLPAPSPFEVAPNFLGGGKDPLANGLPPSSPLASSEQPDLSAGSKDGASGHAHLPGGLRATTDADIGPQAPHDASGSAARGSLRTSIDHQQSASNATGAKQIRGVVECRGMAKSPPPPSLQHLHPPSRNADHAPRHPAPLPVRPPSPVLLTGAGGVASAQRQSPGSAGKSHIQLLQMNHAAAMAGMSPVDLVALKNQAGSPGPAGNTANSSSSAKEGGEMSSSSDVESESDLSFDDSASDRSD